MEKKKSIHTKYLEDVQDQENIKMARRYSMMIPKQENPVQQNFSQEKNEPQSSTKAQHVRSSVLVSSRDSQLLKTDSNLRNWMNNDTDESIPL